jgi:hypothetical protein
MVCSDVISLTAYKVARRIVKDGNMNLVWKQTYCMQLLKYWLDYEKAEIQVQLRGDYWIASNCKFTVMFLPRNQNNLLLL